MDNANITVKKEKANDGDVNDIDDFSELSKLLEEVKREDTVLTIEEPASNGKSIEDKIPDGESSQDACSDDDIRQLHELLEKKKNELKETEKLVQSLSPNKSNRKRKSRDTDKTSVKNDKRAKRVDEPHCSSSHEVHEPTRDRSKSPSPRPQTAASSLVTSSDNLQQPTIKSEVPTTIDAAACAELENLLKFDDCNSDEEPQSSDQGIASSSGIPPSYNFPGVVQMVTPTYDAGNQIMGIIPPNNYALMFNMGLQSQFYPAHMGNMPMMGYGPTQMNMSAVQNELECLPVVNSAGFSGMPTFKRIKLERTTEAGNGEAGKEDVSPEDRRKKVFEACTALLENIEIAQPSTGKFIFTSTVGKLKADAAGSNSIVQKISNVSYEFHSIGPKLNLADWGLREIGKTNIEIAKKIAMNADEYFAKIAEKANTMARKLIKVENAKNNENTEEMEMEIEEPTLSTFLKNSMTQTEALVCGECVARKRKVGHNIAVQATVYTGSIGSQTSLTVDDNFRLTSGLNANQLRALYEFSTLIREPPKNTTLELNRLRERLLEMYNMSISKRSIIGTAPNLQRVIYSMRSPPRAHTQAPFRDPRADIHSHADPRREHIPTLPLSSMQAQLAQFQFAEYPRPPFSNREYSPANNPPVNQFSGYPHPAFHNRNYPPAPALPDVRKGYGRGSQPR